jgi:uncharacterized protein (TIGR03437 family)
MRMMTAVLGIIFGLGSASAQTYTISTFAGGGLPENSPGTSVSLRTPQSIAVDKAGNIFFTSENTVQRLDATTGVRSVVAGNGAPGFSGDDGLATSAQLNAPNGVAVDTTGKVYVVDFGNNRVRRVSNGVISTVAGNGTQGFSGDNGPAASAQLNYPFGVAVDSAGNLYIADTGNGRIREVSNGVISTIAGGGSVLDDNVSASAAQLAGPVAVALDSAGNFYISAYETVRRVSNGIITTVMRPSDLGAFPRAAILYSPRGITADSSGNLYIADVGNFSIWKLSNGALTIVAGNRTPGFSGDAGPAANAQLSGAADVAVDSAGTLYIADANNNRIRKVSGGVITTVGGNGSLDFGGDNGPATGAQLNLASVNAGVALDTAGNLYFTDTYNHRVRKISRGVITTVAGNGVAGFGGDSGPATTAQLNQPQGVAVDSAGNLYIADTLNSRVRKVSGGVITTVAGNGTPSSTGDNGPAANASLVYPEGLAVDAAGNLYIADVGGARLRRVSNGLITTVAGNGTYPSSGDGGPATSAGVDPLNVAVDAAGNLYIADDGSGDIRKVSNGVITTVAGNSTYGFSGDNGPAINAALDNPNGVAVDSAGNLYITDTVNNVVRRVSNGVITTVAGRVHQGSYAGSFGGDNGPATSADLSLPQGIAVDAAGNLYFADSGDNRIRLLTPGTAPLISQNGIVPVYSPNPVIQPGCWISIYGSDLASTTTLWNGDFPTSLGGTSVTIDNKPAYLWVVSPTQINLQVPDDSTTGPVSVVVATPSGTATSTVTLAPQAPSFSLLGDNKHVAAEIATPNGTGAYANGAYDLLGPTNTFSFSARPVKPGETLTLFGVGFGSTSPVVPAGKVFSSSAPTTAPVTVTIGGVSAPISFSGIVEAGLYQINLTLPNAPSGDQPVVATINGVQTPPGPVVAVQ